MTNSFLNLPAPFRQRLERIVPAQHLARVQESFCQARLPSFRINTLKATVDEVLQELQTSDIICHRFSWLNEACWVALEDRSRLTHHHLAESGAIYLHNISSMFASAATDALPDQTVLDLAAAPGGKTLHIAAMMNGTGTLSAVEPIRNRFFKLKENLKRAGADFVKCYMLDGRQVAAKTGPRFDHVLLDAPCSSEARFHSEKPETFDKWSLRKVAECRRKQKGLIKSAFQALQPGGTLIYSTCSFAPEENEATVASLLKKFGDHCQVLPLEMPFDNWQPGLTQWEDLSFPESIQHCRRILPTDHYNALFVAKIFKAN